MREPKIKHSRYMMRNPLIDNMKSIGEMMAEIDSDGFSGNLFDLCDVSKEELVKKLDLIKSGKFPGSVNTGDMTMEEYIADLEARVNGGK